MELIKQWIKAPRRVYDVGVQLYNVHGTDGTLKRLFTSDIETPYKRDKLLKALKAIVDGTEAIKKEESAQAAAESTTTATQATFHKTWPKDSNRDDVETGLWEKAIVLLKTIAHIHSSLMHLPTDDERRAAAFQLLRHDEDLDEVYAARAYYRDHGHLPGKANEPEYPTDAFHMAQRIENLGRYIRRERAAIAKKPDSPEAAARLKEFLTEYNFYARKLGKEELC